MRTVFAAFALLVIFSGCTGETNEQKPAAQPASGPAEKKPAVKEVSSAFEGVWSGNVYEKGSAMPVEFELKLTDGKYGGTFKILGEGDEEQFEILQAEATGNKITFVIPIEGEINEEAVKLDLEVKGDILAGRLKEMKEHREAIPVSFRRKKTQ